MTLPDTYSLRTFEPGDERRLTEITRAAIRDMGPRYYSAEQVAAWASRHPSSERIAKRAAQGAHIVVAVERTAQPVAYALLERDTVGDGHLDMLYCHPDHTRRGLADALLSACEDRARAWDCPRLYTEASELARRAFERSGYQVTARRDFTIEAAPEHGGGEVPIHNYAMEKPVK
ncbi:MAG: GNAT family N-acetyltransferase [Pseudomonadota bacterium]